MSNDKPPTVRIEAFSDGVIAIIITLLVFQINVPKILSESNSEILSQLLPLLPQLLSYAISFFTIAIFWVNHHHFFHQVAHSDWKLMWHNNHLLFWLALVPFTTNFLGAHPFTPLVASLYAFVLGMAALAFYLMTKYAFLKSDLMHIKASKEAREKEVNRAKIGVAAYFLAALIAPFVFWIALILIFIIPFFYFVPTLLEQKNTKPHMH